MTHDLFWIPGPWPGRLAISTRPRGGDWLEDDVRGWRTADIDVVVSLFQKTEEASLELGEEGRLAEANGIRFISFPIVDRGVPESVQSAGSLLREIGHALNRGQTVVVHCRQGIGRSGLIAAGVLMAGGRDLEPALQVVSWARGLSIPETPEQRQWIERFLVLAP